MANLYGADYNSAFQAATPQNIEPAKAGGRIRCLVDSVTLASAQINDVIFMGGTKLPAGAQVLGWVLDTEDLGTATTLTLKAVGAATITLSSALDCATAAAVYRETEQAGNVPQQAVTESDVTLTVLGGAATGTVNLIVRYSID